MPKYYYGDMAAGRSTQWTSSEDRILVAYYASKGPQWIFEQGLLEFDRSPRAITRRAGTLGLYFQPKMARHSFGLPWSFAEEAIINEHWAKGLSPAQPPELPCRTRDAVIAKLNAMAQGKSRSRKIRSWTAEDEAILRVNYAKSGARKCSELLGRSVASVTNRACDLGLTKSQKGQHATRGSLVRKRTLKGAA